MEGLFIRPIAHIHTDYAQKFGIPRQSGLVEHAQGVIVFEPEFAKNKAVQGLEEFTHLWLIWQFENGREGGSAADVAADVTAGAALATNAENDQPQAALSESARNAEDPVAAACARRWSATVRPPRLGGAQKKGVFATRSPFRPNPLGLSCVAIERVERTAQGPLIYVRGADLRDNTPIFDIKPYLPLADCWPEASGGFTDHLEQSLLEVEAIPEALGSFPAEKRDALLEVIANDPRPVGASEDAGHVYSLAYAGYEVQFAVEGTRAQVISTSKID